MNTEDDEFARIAMEQSLREKALQQLHDENERLGLYDDVYGIPFVEKDKLQQLLSTNEILPTPSDS